MFNALAIIAFYTLVCWLLFDNDEAPSADAMWDMTPLESEFRRKGEIQ